MINESLIKVITDTVLSEIDKKNNNFSKGVPIGVSNRHVHLSEKDLYILFGQNYQLQSIKDLKQTGEFACKEVVTLVNNDRKIERVRILGPCRSETQVEISQTDARLLKLNPPVRNSGDLKGSESITLVGPKGKVELKEACIIASRHIHFPTEMAEEMGIKNNHLTKIRLFGEKSGVLEDVYCKVKDSYVFELHLDTDDANAFRVKTGDVAQIIE
ncbi:MAG: phosphate propanoyltransferase [Eubacteriales bacterium]